MGIARGRVQMGSGLAWLLLAIHIASAAAQFQQVLLPDVPRPLPKDYQRAVFPTAAGACCTCQVSKKSSIEAREKCVFMACAEYADKFCWQDCHTYAQDKEYCDLVF